MVNKKEKAENIVPLKGWVVVEVHMPKEIVTDSGVILTNNPGKTFDGIRLYSCKVIRKGADVPDNIKVGAKYKMDILAGTAIPTEGKKYIKVVEHSLLVGEEAGPNAADFMPHHERILVKVTSLQETTESGILLPHGAKSIWDLDTLGGEVVAVSPDLAKDFYPGETIRWEAFQGIEMEFKNSRKDSYIIIPVYAVLAKIEQE